MGMQEEIGRMASLGLLDRLLSDKTTKAPILWGTDAYSAWGSGYGRDREITVEMLVQEPFRLMSRAEKDRDAQAERTKAHAEVFTPLRIVRQMNDFADGEWFGRPDVFLRDGAPTERVLFPAGKNWREYVDSRRLEITCGEAPYLVSRYDVSTGEAVPLARRVGMLDRKLRVVNENAATEKEWFAWALRAFQATYGYEFQGDNVLIARLNLLMTFEEYLAARWNRQPTEKEYAAVTGVIPWNIWQMDGLTGTIPYGRRASRFRQEDLFASIGMAGPEEEAPGNVRPGCRVKNWRGGGSVEFSELPTRRKRGMKFDFIIGNPPYQDETVGDQKTFAPPIYNRFMEEAYRVADRVELIHPARFLFNAGSTPKAWNEKMLADPHFKVLLYEQNSANFFPNTDVKGGVAVSYRDAEKNFGAIGTFTAFPELNSILHKVNSYKNLTSFSKIVVTRTAYRLTDKLHNDHPEAAGMLSKGHLYDMATNIFESLPHVFFDEKPSDNHQYIQIFGRLENERKYMYIRADYVNSVANLYKWKIFVPKANGSGALGEVLTTPVIGQPVIGQPVIGHTESFISIGCFDTEEEARACYQYICTKFARCMLGVLKVTQDNPPEKWKYVPLQDFTPASDIDWSKSVPEIDRQLYAKYGLDEAEIAFIETHVKEMA